MRIITATQRTPAWYAARTGRVTASAISKVLAGKQTKARRGYISDLVLDLEGVPNRDDEDTPPWFIDGIFYEKHALGWYQWKRDVDVMAFGFCVHDDFDWLGCSPDGAVGAGGGIEIKFRKSLKSYRDHINKHPATSVYAQIQCQMWIMGWQWVDYLNYWRDEKLEIEQGHIERIYRDQAYIDSQLYEYALAFWADVLSKYKARNGTKPFAIDLQVPPCNSR